MTAVILPSDELAPEPLSPDVPAVLRAHGVTLISGNCIDAMRAMPANSGDLIATDPPHGIEFMHQKWDKFKAAPNQASGTQTNE